MTEFDLRTDDGLRRACKRAGEKFKNPKWTQRLSALLTRVQQADRDERSSVEFHRELWDRNAVAATGQGAIDVSAAIDDPGFRSWVAQESLRPLPAERDARLAQIVQFRDALIARLKAFNDRTPHLKIYRVLTAFYPEHFTTVAARTRLRALHSSMFDHRARDSVERHFEITERLAEVLGDCGDDIESRVERMQLPWKLHQLIVADPVDEVVDPDEELVPLPAIRRRRGLTSISGGLGGVAETLEFIKDGIPRVDLIDHLRARNPTAKDSTLATSINVLQSELGVVRRDGENYVLTPRGEALLETGDPDELSDWLLGRILGPDFVLVHLRDQGPTSKTELLEAVQSINPGWTTLYAPQALLWWLRHLGVIEISSGTVKLTERGRQWAARIHWKPEPIPKDVEPDDGDQLPEVVVATIVPPIDSIVERVGEAGTFASELVARLHSGLWAHERRHFAVLTGLSGSGKTLLARSYAAALDADPGKGKHLVVPVEPGWYDPSPLFGYVNPLRGDSYVRTQFLEFLLSAVAHPREPHCAILDEMNLSHPEQYLAPILSAMETGAHIVFHREGDSFDGIPSSVPYPRNLALLGTVNMDETTQGLSDKVLDRAFTIEFWDVDLDGYSHWVRDGLSEQETQRAREVLIGLYDALAPARLHFGWRTVKDVLDFLVHANGSGSVLDSKAALDSVIYAKVLPKLRGSDTSRVREALEGCQSVLKRFGLDVSMKKVEELARDIEETGSARFWR